MKLILIGSVIAAALAAGGAPDNPNPPRDHVWNIDATHSSVVFKVKHASSTWFYGTFSGVSGALTLDPDHPEAGKVDVKIDAASVGTRDEKRDQHLRGPDFFDAKQFPDITFTSTKFAKDGDGYKVSGDLSLHGQSKPLSVHVTKTGEGEFYGKRVGFETTFTIKRSDFGMDYGVAKQVLGDEVTLMLGLELVQDDGKGK